LPQCRRVSDEEVWQASMARSNGLELDWRFEVGEQEINRRQRSKACGTLKKVVLPEGDLAGRNDFHSGLINFRENTKEDKHQ
jgi:hypothetical protein